MPKQVQLRRGTTTEHATFAGAAGEVTVDTTRKCAVVHDGVTPGGVPLARRDECILRDTGSPEDEQILKSRLTITGGADVDFDGLSVAKPASFQSRVLVTRLSTLSFQICGTYAPYALAMTLDFAAASFERIVLAGDLTLATAHLEMGRLFKVIIVADGSPRNLHFPGWTWIGGSPPATIGANKAGLLELLSGGWADNDVLARWTVQP
jgi:hypothetical protein